MSLLRDEARRRGYRDDCADCRRAVAVQGQPACVKHYRPDADVVKFSTSHPMQLELWEDAA